MTEETNQEESASESPNVRQMRTKISDLEENLKQMQAENAKLQGAVRLTAFKEVGLDPEADGLGKAIFKLYDGEPNTETISEFAQKEFGWNPPPKQAKSAVESRMDQLESASHAPDLGEKDIDTQIKEAMAGGDFVTANSLKAQKIYGSLDLTL